MDKFMYIIQFIMACIMLLCVIVSAVAHTVMGHITSFLGYLVAIIFIVLTYPLFRIALREMLNEFKK